MLKLVYDALFSPRKEIQSGPTFPFLMYVMEIAWKYIQRSVIT